MPGIELVIKMRDSYIYLEREREVLLFKECYLKEF